MSERSWSFIVQEHGRFKRRCIRLVSVHIFREYSDKVCFGQLRDYSWNDKKRRTV